VRLDEGDGGVVGPEHRAGGRAGTGHLGHDLGGFYESEAPAAEVAGDGESEQSRLSEGGH
jgi:hypothetical protein